MLPFHKKKIKMDLNDENHGIAPRGKTMGAKPWGRNYPVFTALSGI